MLNLEFKYSLEYERKRIKEVLDDADWFIKNGYSKWIKLPNNENLEDSLKKNSLNYLLKRAEEEYDKNEFIKIKEIVNERLPLFYSNLEKYFQDTSLKKEDSYFIYFTKYGVGGSYNLPNKIVINTQIRKGKGLIKSIIHEIVHLSIQNLIDKYKVDHWKKERIVDLILEVIVPEINKIQEVPIDTEKIDKNFKEYYPDIEKIIKVVAE